MEGDETIIVVSGIPRSGTSLVMQMLEAGGVRPLADAERPPDAGNPRGYYELAAVQRLPADTGWLAEARGHAVKVIHALVDRLPEGPRYRILWIERDLAEVVRSQSALLAQLGAPPTRGLSDARLAEILSQQLAQVAAKLDSRPDMDRLTVSHATLIADPSGAAARIDAFRGAGLDVDAMARVVDPSLYRVRAKSP